MSDNNQTSDAMVQVDRERVRALLVSIVSSAAELEATLPAVWRLIDRNSPDQLSSEEKEASAILERVDRELASVEERTNRLMHHYGL